MFYGYDEEDIFIGFDIFLFLFVGIIFDEEFFDEVRKLYCFVGCIYCGVVLYVNKY